MQFYYYTCYYKHKNSGFDRGNSDCQNVKQIMFATF